jgi:hypothetical protein
MIQPKDLYRKLAMLLAEIDEGRDKEDYLLSVLATLNNSFIRTCTSPTAACMRTTSSGFSR